MSEDQRPASLHMMAARRTRRVFLTICGSSLAALATGRRATGDDSYPSRPIHIIVPFSAGGATDVLARLIGEELRKRWNQPVVIENRVGASGNIGAAAVAKAAPDGYTLLMGAIGTNAVNAALFDNMPYDTATAFAPVTQVASLPMVVVLHPSVPIGSVAELAAHVKEKPGALTHGAAGKGASQHLASLLFETLTGGKFLQVFYRGAAALVPDLLTGRINLTFGDMASLMPYVTSGQIRAIAVTTKRRSPQLPDIPTVAEAGVPGYEATAWYGVFAPAGTPPSIVAKLRDVIANILREPRVAASLLTFGAAPVGSTPDEFRAFVLSEMKRWGKIVRGADVKAD